MISQFDRLSIGFLTGRLPASDAMAAPPSPITTQLRLLMMPLTRDYMFEAERRAIRSLT